MARNPLTPSECRQILSLRKAGSSLTKIAKEMHRGTKVISEILNASEGNLSSPRKSNQEFNKVSLEHRAVIKFLCKLGKENQEIFEDIKTAYEENYPSVESIDYWATQFKKGRELVLFSSVLPRKGRGRPKVKPPPKRWMWVQTKPRASGVKKKKN